MTHDEAVRGPARPAGRLRSAISIRPDAEHQPVTTLELFFDLVFVFALTQVTAFMAEQLTWIGLLQGVLVVALLWWSWTGYAWLGNLVRADEGLLRIGVFAAMAAMFVIALTIPEAFGDFAGGLYGPVVIAVAYFVFRMLHLGLYALSAAGDPGLRRQLLRFTPSVVGGTALLLAAAAVEGPMRTVLWIAALLADYFGTYLAGAGGWRLRSTGHFAERHGLIVIIALGESIVAIGVGVAALPISWPIVIASVLGLATAAALWWVYFDVAALAGERALSAAPEADRPRLARDAYSYLHLPMAIGIVLLALGLKKVLEYVGDTEGHTLADPLKGVALVALVGGVVLYLLAHVAFALRLVHRLHTARLVGAVALVPLAFLGAALPALATLGVLTAVVLAVVVYEAIHDAARRDEVRHGQEHATHS